ncbi:hypothetical protein HDU98_009621 [Podochytrium sp. JEL0797]|nr:hypothetical protein HDU98_009621 [Podochytrium sp. JEL0797]
MFSSRMNFLDQVDWCDSGVLAVKQRLAASGRLLWVAGQDICPTGYSQGGIASRGEFGPLGYAKLGGAYGRQNLRLLQQQQQLFDDLECSNFGQNHPFLASHPLLGAAVNRFQHSDHPVPRLPSRRVKVSIVDQIVQDRQRDEIQAHLIKQLIRKSSTNRNNMGLIQALVSLLAEGAIMDYVTETMVKNFRSESVKSRNADHIIYDLASGRPHLPHPEQKAIAEHAVVFHSALMGVPRFTAPYANKRIVTDQAIAKVLDTVAKAQQVGYGSCVTPFGIQYGPAWDFQQQQ